MAMQVKTVSNKLFNPVLNLVRNRSRALVPSLFWEDPFRHHRNLIADFWNKPDPFDVLFPSHRYTAYGIPSIARQEEKYLNNPNEGFQVSFNVEHFSPNEISVKVIDNCILVEAKHEERSEDGEGFVSRQISRRYVLPDDYNIKDVVSTLSSDGILTVSAPPKQLDPKNARNIHIQETGSPASSSSSESKENEKKSDETTSEDK